MSSNLDVLVLFLRLVEGKVKDIEDGEKEKGRLQQRITLPF